MSETSDFAGKVQRRQSELNGAAQAARAAQEERELENRRHFEAVEQRKSRIKDLIAARDERNRNFVGTPLSELWSTEKVELADEFLRLMASRAYIGAALLYSCRDNVSRKVFRSVHDYDHKTVEGYPIGGSTVFVGRPGAEIPGHYVNDRVYLCADAALRIGEGSGEHYHGKTVVAQGGLIGKDLPLDRDGERLPITIGEIKRVQMRTQPRVEYDQPHGGESHYTDIIYGDRITERPLEDVLVNIAARSFV